MKSIVKSNPYVIFFGESFGCVYIPKDKLLRNMSKYIIAIARVSTVNTLISKSRHRVSTFADEEQIFVVFF